MEDRISGPPIRRFPTLGTGVGFREDRPQLRVHGTGLGMVSSFERRIPIARTGLWPDAWDVQTDSVQSGFRCHVQCLPVVVSPGYVGRELGYFDRAEVFAFG